VLCMPVTCKRADDGDTGEDREHCFTRFIFRPNWFVMAQTDGSDFVPEPIGDFDLERALQALSITRETFVHSNGNAQGYARPGRVLAISPLAALPYKTSFHEMGHILLGHCDQGEQSDGETIEHSLVEAEAEAVALLCCESLGLPGAEYSRGYIQHWLKGSTIPERSAQRIFKAADQIIKAGTSVPAAGVL
jgi:hypothetical protein